MHTYWKLYTCTHLIISHLVGCLLYNTLFLSGNHLASTRQLVGQTVQSEAMATDAVRAVVNYRITVSRGVCTCMCVVI